MGGVGRIPDDRAPSPPFFTIRRKVASSSAATMRALESLDGSASVSRANQTAAFRRISRSSRSALFSRRRRRTSSRSSVVRPSARRPASRSACRSQFRIVWADGSNCRPSSSGVRPVRASSTRRARSWGGYGGRVFGIVDSLLPPRGTVSTEAGQLHYWELARLWGVAPKTIKNWVYLDRRRGLVVAGRYRLVRVRGQSRRREFLIRADAAMALFDRHVGALIEKTFRRASAGSTPGPACRLRNTVSGNSAAPPGS
jgi:hypothetical protein